MSKRITRRRIGRWILLSIIIIIVCLIFVLTDHHHPQQVQTRATPTTIVATQQQEPWFINPTLAWHKITVKRGDTLSSLFGRYHISYTTLKKILAAPDVKNYLQKLHPAQTFYLHTNPSLKKIAIKYKINNDRTLYTYSDQQKFQSRIIDKLLTKHVVYKSETIEHTFAGAAHKVGLTYAQAHQLSEIFAGNVNFSRDIRPGDTFSILYDEYFLHGKREKPGNILAARITNRGKTYTAIRFTYPRNHTGYYTPEGHGVEPLFLKKPVKYKRISSYFKLHRYDPVLHIIHPHFGVDLAAPRGTPIKSIGDGKVIYHGWKGGYGKAVIVRYSKKYKALYGHMSRFSKGLINGKRVKKGEVIGYIGSTGWATGPHLHFEVYVYGIPRNPLKMKFIGGKSIPKNYLSIFHEKADALLATLKMYQGQEFAMIDSKDHEQQE